LVPHAFAWLTEQRPVATVLGTELDLRLFSYRDSTPLRAAQVDDEPYGGGAGMVLRVDVVAAALDAVYDGVPDQRVIALTPQGRQLTQDVVEELAEEERLTLLSARFEGFDERVVPHLASGTIRRFCFLATTERSRNGEGNRVGGGPSRERSLRAARRATRRVAAGDRVGLSSWRARARLPGWCLA